MVYGSKGIIYIHECDIDEVEEFKNYQELHEREI